MDLPGTAEAEERLRLEEAHVAEIDQRRARLDGLVGDEPPDGLPGRRDEAALEIEQKTSALEALGPIAQEPRARERLEVEVADAERSLERARDDEAAARARVEQNPVDAEEVAGLAERLASWSEELAALLRRDRVYTRTLAEINAAEQATMQRATRYLERRMVADVARITGGRYRRVRVDDTNLGIEVFAPERDDWVPVTDLSQGTLDVVYLAARLGLVRLVTGDRRPPLVLDDPFVTLDDTRGAAGAGAAAGAGRGLPGDLPDHLGPVRPPGRGRPGAGGSDRGGHPRGARRGAACLSWPRAWPSSCSALPRRSPGEPATSAAACSAGAPRCSGWSPSRRWWAWSRRWPSPSAAASRPRRAWTSAGPSPRAWPASSA